MSLRLDILPKAQRALWQQLGATPSYFTLYGGTAIALQLGHRQSIDFDFFAAHEIIPNDLLQSIPYLNSATVIQLEANTLACQIGDKEPVNVSFFGLPWLKQIRPHMLDAASGVRLASLIDLAGTKMHTVQQRAEVKDYLDIDALLQSGLSLGMMLSAATYLFGAQFNPVLTLKALTYFEEGNVLMLPQDARNRLRMHVRETHGRDLPPLEACIP